MATLPAGRLVERYDSCGSYLGSTVTMRRFAARNELVIRQLANL